MGMRTTRQAPGTARVQPPGAACPAGTLGSSSLHLPDLDALYSRLAEADEAEDTAALAALAWELYGLLGSLGADRDAVRARLHQVLAATAGRQFRQLPGHAPAGRETRLALRAGGDPRNRCTRRSSLTGRTASRQVPSRQAGPAERGPAGRSPAICALSSAPSSTARAVK